MKKVLTLFLVIILALTFITPAFAGNDKDNKTESDGPTIVLTRIAANEIIELKNHRLTYEINFIPPTATPTTTPTTKPTATPTTTIPTTTTATIPKRIILIKNYQDPSIQEFSCDDSIVKDYFSDFTENFDAEFEDYRPKVDIYHINFDSKKSLEQQFENALKNDGHLKYIVFLDEDNTKNEDILNNIKDQVKFKLDTYTKLHYNILNHNVQDLDIKDLGLYKNVADMIKYGLPENTSTLTPTSTQPPAQSGDYSVSYTQNAWGTGATVNLTIKNNSSTAVNGWTVNFSFAGNQKITNSWNCSYTQNGNSVSITNASYNSTIPAGGSVTVGFNISYSGTNTQPTNFVVNTASSGGSTPTPTVVPTTTTEIPTFEFEEVLPVEVKTVKSNNPKLTITKNAEGRFVVKGELDVATTNFTIDVTYHYQYFKVTYNDENSWLTVNYAGQTYIEHFNGLTVNIKHIIDVQ